MQPFDDSLYSGYSTYNNWAKVPSTPSSLAKASFAWGLTSSAASAFNSAASQSLGYGASSTGVNTTGHGSNNYMYSAVVSASSTSPTTTSDQEMGSKPDLQQYSNLAPISTRLKSSKEELDLQPHRDVDDVSRGTTSTTAYSISTSAASNTMV